jgi:translation initiation factor 1A
MVNERGGSGYKKGKKKPSAEPQEIKGQVIDIDSGHGNMYALVVKNMGPALEVKCSDGKTLRARIPGKFRKKVWLNAGDIVLLDCPEDFKGVEATVMYKLDPAEIRKLRADKTINFEGQSNNNNMVGIKFGEDDDDDTVLEDDKEFEQFASLKSTKRLEEISDDEDEEESTATGAKPNYAARKKEQDLVLHKDREKKTKSFNIDDI